MSLVSIVLPCYNHEDYIVETIQSVIEQDYENIELIIIDDGSTDNTYLKACEMFDLCKKRFLRFELRTRENKGLCETLNEGIEWCKGEFYSAIASDDVLMVNKTKLQVCYLNENRSVDGVFGGVFLIDSSGKTISTKYGKPGVYSFEEIFLVEHSFNAPTQMIRLEAIRRVGLLPKGLFIEDWYMWLKLLSRGKLAEIEEILAKYRIHGNNSSKNIDKLIASRLQIINMFSEHPLKSRALASSILSNAMDIQYLDRFHSLRLFLKALNLNFRLVFSRRCSRYLLKSLLPKSLLSFVNKKYNEY